MTMTNEHWRPVPGYEGRYDVSDLGCVRSWCWTTSQRPEPRPLAPGIDSEGYRRVHLRASPRTAVKSVRVHVLVLLAFVGPRPPCHEIRHLDGNRLNNTLTNLTYGTKSQNVRDAIAHGTHRSPFVSARSA